MAINLRAVPCWKFNYNEIETDDEPEGTILNTQQLIKSATRSVTRSYNINSITRKLRNLKIDKVPLEDVFTDNSNLIIINGRIQGSLESNQITVHSVPCSEAIKVPEVVNSISTESSLIIRSPQCPKANETTTNDWSERVFFPNGPSEPGLIYWEKNNIKTFLDPEYIEKGYIVDRLWTKWVYFDARDITGNIKKCDNRLFWWVNDTTGDKQTYNPYKLPINKNVNFDLSRYNVPLPRLESHVPELLELNTEILTLYKDEKKEEAKKKFDESMDYQNGILREFGNSILENIRGSGDVFPFSLSIRNSDPIPWPSSPVPKLIRDSMINKSRSINRINLQDYDQIIFELYSPAKEMEKLIIRLKQISPVPDHFSPLDMRLKIGGKIIRGKSKKLIRHKKRMYTRRKN